ncbi:MAG: ABC transporter permease [Clostridia bacterium]|nr:ABC transporter permease [Clostridia bacterium]
MKQSFLRIMTLSSRNVKEILREPLSLVFMIIMPLVMQVGFYYLFHSQTSQFDMKYLTPAIVVFSQSFLTLFTGTLISADRSTTFLTRLFVSNAKPYEFLVSYVFAVLPIAFLQSILFFLVGSIIDFSIFSINVVVCLLTSVLSALFFINLGVLFGSLLAEKSIGGVSSIVIMGQSVLSGMWFPTEGLKGGFIVVMNLLPFRNSSLLIQNVLNGINDLKSNFLIPLFVVGVYSIVTFLISIFVFKRKVFLK